MLGLPSSSSSVDPRSPILLFIAISGHSVGLDSQLHQPIAPPPLLENGNKHGVTAVASCLSRHTGV